MSYEVKNFGFMFDTDEDQLNKAFEKVYGNSAFINFPNGEHVTPKIGIEEKIYENKKAMEILADFLNVEVEKLSVHTFHDDAFQTIHIFYENETLETPKNLHCIIENVKVISYDDFIEDFKLVYGDDSNVEFYDGYDLGGNYPQITINNKVLNEDEVEELLENFLKLEDLEFSPYHINDKQIIRILYEDEKFTDDNDQIIMDNFNSFTSDIRNFLNNR